MNTHSIPNLWPATRCGHGSTFCRGAVPAALGRERLRCAGWLLALLGGSLAVGLAGAGEAPANRPAARSPVKILVAYYSYSGNTEQMAKGVVEGVKRVTGTAVTLKKIEDVTKDDLAAADGLILGGPTYYGSLPGKMKVVLDDWAWKMGVDFTDKAGGAFSTGGGQTGGKEFVVVNLLVYMINNRMIVAGPLYQNDKTGSVWAELGSSAMTGPLDPGVGAQELDAARRLGERVARLAIKLTAPSSP